MKAFVIVAGAVATGTTAIVWFPESWPAHAFGWMVYLMIAIIGTTWYTGLLIVAVLSIWWVLRQPALSRADGKRPSRRSETPHARSMPVTTRTPFREE